MAKRKTTRKATSRRRSSRRRGIGAINPGSMVLTIGGVLGGVALAGYLNKFLFTPKEGQTATDTQVMLGKYAPLVAGIITPMILKNELGKNLGSGMIAYGGAKILQSVGLAGTDEMETISIGADNIPVIAGTDYALAGYDDYAVAGNTIPTLAGMMYESLDN